MNYLNLTPHKISIIKKEVTIKTRHNRVYLLNKYSDDDPRINLIEPIQPYHTPLTLEEVGMQVPQFSSVPFYNAIGSANTSNIDFQEIDKADVIVISQKSATWVNSKAWMAVYQKQQGNIWADIALLDKFVVPYDVVYKDRKPIGALGLQKVTPYFADPCYGLCVYATMIQQGRNVSLQCLYFYCYHYYNLTNQNFMCRTQEGEDALRVATDYFARRGWNVYFQR